MEYNLITPSEFASFCPEVNTTQYSQATISGMLAQASQRVVDYLEYSPIYEIIVDEVKKGIVKNTGDLLIKPAKLPIVSVEAIKIYKGSQELALTLQANGVNKYNIDFSSREIIYPYYEFQASGSLVISDFLALRYTDFYIKLSYTAGWMPDNLPATIKQATTLYMRDLLSQSSNPTGANSISQGAISLSYSSGRFPSKFISEAQRLLGPYKRIG